ncbi:diacylglycerol/lipid kinase family protein [Fuchsiella alkaliacetigena]|uniref:diacylglycerol/lipid kinase family protein n=1 Tax=Fuchsiella alkaliacetigena TaxID=957042 RepID=UPI00200A0657|nr:diacylglycerol kinase family protein [Fuchsiella alkaliacetigena]MCK8826053.1 diacylglycerol kinase family lipid kinase [Fuchsiella alkaliacetigena]
MKNDLNYQLIANPAAGNGKTNKILSQVEKIFRENNCSFKTYVTTGAADATTAARKAVKNGAEVVVAVGGDGTVNEVANGLVGTEAKLATIPAGTGNDFARTLRMSKEIEKACAEILTGECRAIDLGKVLNRYFVNLVGVGFDGAVGNEINQRNKFLPGPWPYLLAIFKVLFSYQPVQMKISMDEQTLHCTPTLVAVGIGQCCGGGIRLVPDAIQDDGLFDVCVIDSLGKLETLYHLPKLLTAEHKKLDQVNIYRSREVKLEVAKELPLQMEGEVFLLKSCILLLNLRL